MCVETKFKKKIQQTGSLLLSSFDLHAQLILGSLQLHVHFFP